MEKNKKKDMTYLTHFWTHNIHSVMPAIFVIIANQIFITLDLRVIYFA